MKSQEQLELDVIQQVLSLDFNLTFALTSSISHVFN